MQSERNRRGRKRKSTRDREKNGRVVRDTAQETRTKMAEFFAEQPERRGASDPLDPRLGYPLGRLNYSGVVDKRQHDAGERLAALAMKYGRTIGMPPPVPQAISDSLVGRGLSIAPEPDPAEVAAVRRAYDDAYAALLEAGGKKTSVIKICRDVCILGRHEVSLTESQTGDLRLGLNALARLFGIPLPEEQTRRDHPFGMNVAA